MTRRWFAIGDPQATLAKLLAVLANHGLLDSSDRLHSEVGLVSMGDHFDYGATADVDTQERREAGLEGCRVLQWLADHPREQARILVGNHDLARVQELAEIDDATFAAARLDAAALRRLPLDRRPEATVVFHDRYPQIPTPDLACRDFSTFLVAQRELVQRLLVAGRLDCALVGELDGTPCLLSHTGVTRRELELLDLETADPSVVAARANEWLRARVERVSGAWSAGKKEPLDLAPLHLPGRAPIEAGGWFAFRPSNPDRPHVTQPEWEWTRERPRRFHPRELPAGLLQVVGHTRHHKLEKELVPWVEDVRIEGDAVGVFRRLSVHEDVVRYGTRAAADRGAAVMVFADMGLHEVGTAQAGLLALDALTVPA